DPLELLSRIAGKTDRLFLWTHYVPDEGVPPDATYAPAIVRVEEIRHQGQSYHLYRRRYLSSSADPKFCGGIYESPAWLPRGEILTALGDLGFSKLTVGFDDPLHPNGPSFAIVALR